MDRTQCQESKDTVPPASKLMSHHKAVSGSGYDSDAKEDPSALGMVLISRTTRGTGSPCGHKPVALVLERVLVAWLRMHYGCPHVFSVIRPRTSDSQLWQISYSDTHWLTSDNSSLITMSYFQSEIMERNSQLGNLPLHMVHKFPRMCDPTGSTICVDFAQAP